MEHSLISLWSEYEKFSIIDTGSMLKTIMPNLRKEVRKIHTQNYAITPPATEKSRWQAYLTVRRWGVVRNNSNYFPCIVICGKI